MRIGIITFWQTKDNYGQMLQCLALQRVLQNMGHSPFLIRYAHSEIKLSNFKTRIKQYVKKMLRLCKDCDDSKQYTPTWDIIHKNELRDFESFKEHYLISSEIKYLSLKELQKKAPEADCYVVGSDQVWAKSLYFKENQVFYLNFGSKDILRIAYAASFAMSEYPKKLHSKLKLMLNRFDAISVREQTGVNICNSIGIDASLVLDPTMLLTAKDYNNILNITNKRKTSTCFVYCLNISEPEEIQWREIKQYSYEFSKRIVITPSSGYLPCVEIFGNENYEYCTIPHWIENIACSELLLTTSFHGIVFALLYHTNFVYFPLYGTYSRGNNRVLDLLSELGLEKKICYKELSVENVIKENVDWGDVDYKLEKMRYFSMNFLKKNLNA